MLARPCWWANDVEPAGGAVGGDGAGVLAVDGVVLHEAVRLVKGEEGVIDIHGHDLGVIFCSFKHIGIRRVVLATCT